MSELLAPPPFPFRLGGWGTFAADPPWPYQDQANRMRCDYPPMTVEEICDLPVASAAADVAHLYLWTTSSFVEDAYRVCRAWGFEPLDLFPWVKRRTYNLELRDLLDFIPRPLRTGLDAVLRNQRWQIRGPLQIGGGHRIRHAAEYVLLGMRGKGPLSFPTNLRFSGVIEAPAKGQGLVHSEKPPELYRRAELTSPAPRLEVFARKPRPGWRTWGNDPRLAA